MQVYSVTQTVIASPAAAVCSILSGSSLKAPHTAPQSLSTQRLAYTIKHDMHPRPEQGTHRGRERLTVSHQNIPHLAGCHFWYGQRTVVAICWTLCDSWWWHGSYGIWHLWQMTISLASAPAAFSAVIKSCCFSLQYVHHSLSYLYSYSAHYSAE